jgi:hypothetical protein
MEGTWHVSNARSLANSVTDSPGVDLKNDEECDTSTAREQQDVELMMSGQVTRMRSNAANPWMPERKAMCGTSTHPSTRY